MTVNLMLGDCLDRMGEIEDGTVDLILCDLPYGVTACKWDAVIPFEPLWAHYRRIAKKNAAIVLTASQPFTSALVMSNLGMFRYEWVWHKVQATGFMNARLQPLRACESVLVFYRAPPNYHPEMRTGAAIKRTPHKSVKAGNVYRDDMKPRGADSGTLRFPTTLLEISAGRSPDTRTLHPTQKPVALMEYLIRTYTNEGETVLDNCFGSGTTGVACVNTGRNFIGIERDETYYNIATDRIAKAQRQQAELLPLSAV